MAIIFNGQKVADLGTESTETLEQKITALENKVQTLESQKRIKIEDITQSQDSYSITTTEPLDGRGGGTVLHFCSSCFLE